MWSTSTWKQEARSKQKASRAEIPRKRNTKIVKLAAIAMNPHYHPYSDLSSPHHPPSPDNNNYHGPLSHHNGHSTLSQMDGHHQGFHHMNNNGTVKHCAGCGGELLMHINLHLPFAYFFKSTGKIMERFFLHALDRYWHNSCLKCSCCGAMLADIGTSCFTRSGMILCKADYSRWVICDWRNMLNEWTFLCLLLEKNSWGKYRVSILLASRSSWICKTINYNNFLRSCAEPSAAASRWEFPATKVSINSIGNRRRQQPKRPPICLLCFPSAVIEFMQNLGMKTHPTCRLIHLSMLDARPDSVMSSMCVPLR